MFHQHIIVWQLMPNWSCDPPFISLFVCLSILLRFFDSVFDQVSLSRDDVLSWWNFTQNIINISLINNLCPFWVATLHVFVCLFIHPFVCPSADWGIRIPWTHFLVSSNTLFGGRPVIISYFVHVLINGNNELFW